MNQTIVTATIDTFDFGNGLHLNEANRLRVNRFKNLINTSSNVTLDVAEGLLREKFAGWFVYRGGNHVALHLASGDPRILIVEEREILADEPKYCGKCDSYHRRGPACETFGATTALTRNLQAANADPRVVRVQNVVDSFSGVERTYAAAYAHWADEVGEAAAIAHAANRGKGLTGSRKQAIRKAVNAARS